MASNPNRSARTTTRGFTLVEVILAIMIVSFIMVAAYATLFTTIEARDDIEIESLKAKIGPAILDLVERDISGAWSWNIHRNDVLLGEHQNLNGVPADRIHLITSTDSSLVEMNEEVPVRSDLTEVSYLLRQNPQSPELMELIRRQDFHVDDRITEGGLYELVYSRVRSFEVRYFRDLFEGADYYDEWDAKTRNSLPAAVEIYLSLEIDPRLAGFELTDMERPTQDFHRVIFLPRGSELTMAVRPVVPVYVEPGAPTDGQAGGGAGGKGAGGGPITGGKGQEGLDHGDKEGIVGHGGDINAGKQGNIIKPGGGGGFDRPGEGPPKPDGSPFDDTNFDELFKMLGGGKK